MSSNTDDDLKILQAIKIVKLDKLVESMKKGIYSNINENGEIYLQAKFKELILQDHCTKF